MSARTTHPSSGRIIVLPGAPLRRAVYIARINRNWGSDGRDRSAPVPPNARLDYAIGRLVADAVL